MYASISRYGLTGQGLTPHGFISEILESTCEPDLDRTKESKEILGFIVNDTIKLLLEEESEREAKLEKGDLEKDDSYANILAAKELSRARIIFNYLWEKPVIKEIRSLHDLHSLLNTGIGNKLSALCLYVYLLEHFDISYWLLLNEKDIELMVGNDKTGARVEIESADGFKRLQPISECNSERTSNTEQKTASRAVDIKFLLAAVHLSNSSRAIQSNNPHQALDYCQRAAILAPSLAAPYVNLGLTLKKLNRKKNALQYFRKAVQLEPDRASVHLHYGTCLFQTGDFAGAEQHWNRAKELAYKQETIEKTRSAGDSSRARKGKTRAEIAEHNIRVFAREKQYIPLEQEVFRASRIKDMEKVLEIGKVERRIRNTASVAYLNNYKRAREVFTWVWEDYELTYRSSPASINEVLSVHRGDCALFSVFFGLLFRRFGIECCVMIRADHAFLSFDWENKRIDVETTCRDGFDIDTHKHAPNLTRGKIEVLPALIYHNYAGECLQRGDVALTTMHIKKALSIFPGLAVAHNGLGHCYQREGEREKAYTAYRKAIEIDPWFSQYHIDLAEFYYASDRYQDCARSLRRVLFFSWFENNVEEVIEENRDLFDAIVMQEGSDELYDLVYLPPGIKDRRAFERYCSAVEPGGPFMIDFQGDRKAYHNVGLGDLMEVEKIMISKPATKLFEEASLRKDGAYYYSDSDIRVIIATGTRFIVPLDRLPNL